MYSTLSIETVPTRDLLVLDYTCFTNSTRAENLAHVNKLLQNTELWSSWRLA